MGVQRSSWNQLRLDGENYADMKWGVMQLSPRHLILQIRYDTASQTSKAFFSKSTLSAPISDFKKNSSLFSGIWYSLILHQIYAPVSGHKEHSPLMSTWRVSINQISAVSYFFTQYLIEADYLVLAIVVLHIEGIFRQLISGVWYFLFMVSEERLSLPLIQCSCPFCSLKTA